MPPISICSSEGIKLTGDHFRFDLVFTQNKQPNPKKRPETEPKPAQTNLFRSGFSLVFYAKNRKNLYAFFWAFLAL
jgi:hypothetical protein